MAARSGSNGAKPCRKATALRKAARPGGKAVLAGGRQDRHSSEGNPETQ
ncbi:hypothetical protein HMPREF0972_01420 [Actinomyces sp. oral taxon 848 str. F0332]|nr:hypothetical protein HMPREF0972_01420 [Actinomyces sp. oral taxon 848 str. F0332]